MSLTHKAIEEYRRQHVKLHGTLPDIHGDNGWITISGIEGSVRPTEVIKMAMRLERMARERGEDRTPENMVWTGGRNEIRFGEQREPEHNIWDDMIINVDDSREAIEERERQRDKEEMMRILKERFHQEQNDVWDIRDELRKDISKTIEAKAVSILNDNDEDMHTPVGGWKRSIKKNLIVAFFNRLFESCGNSAFDMERAMNEYAYSGEWILNREADCDGCDYREQSDYLESKVDELESQTERLHGIIENRKTEVRLLKTRIEQMKRKMKELKNNSIVFSMDEVKL